MDVAATPTDRFHPIGPPPPPPPKPKPSSFDKLDAATAGATSALDPATLAAARDAAMTAKIDAYFNAAAAPYAVTTPSGEKVTVKVPPQFRMNGGFNDKAPELLGAALGPDAAKLKRETDLAKVGRASPSDVAKITAALIARGHLGPVTAKDAPAAIQALQWKYGIGVDCAGYVQRAFLACRGKTNIPTDRQGLGLAGSILDEGSQNVTSNKKMKSVAIASARPGDLLSLGAAPSERSGHLVLVRSNRLLSPTEATAMGLKSGGPHRVLEVDSSWGAGEAGKGGGVQRRSWIYDEGEKAWSSWDPATKQLAASTQSGPYDHPLNGIYRPKAEP